MEDLRYYGLPTLFTPMANSHVFVLAELTEEAGIGELVPHVFSPPLGLPLKSLVTLLEKYSNLRTVLDDVSRLVAVIADVGRHADCLGNRSGGSRQFLIEVREEVGVAGRRFIHV